MTNKPFALTNDELTEIASIQDIQEMWGAQDAVEMRDLLQDTVYAVRFNYMSGSPGYCGDVFVLMGDALGEPLTLIREGGKGSIKII